MKKAQFVQPLIAIGVVIAIGFGVALGSGVQAENRTKAVAKTPTAIAPPRAPALTATQFDGLMGGRIDLNNYRGKVVLVVNTASQCGFTGQYAGLETLYRARARDGLVIVGVPSNDFGGQEPGSAGEIKRFCELNYGVTFPMAAKYVVRGPGAHPFYRNALARLGRSAEPAWNFHKILLGKNGQPIAAFPSGTTPSSPELARAINAALAARNP
jgi:glutathione peroxidase